MSSNPILWAWVFSQVSSMYPLHCSWKNSCLTSAANMRTENRKTQDISASTEQCLVLFHDIRRLSNTKWKCAWVVLVFFKCSWSLKSLYSISLPTKRWDSGTREWHHERRKNSFASASLFEVHADRKSFAYSKKWESERALWVVLFKAVKNINIKITADEARSEVLTKLNDSQTQSDHIRTYIVTHTDFYIFILHELCKEERGRSGKIPKRCFLDSASTMGTNSIVED
jgi:hypothetical protein